MGYRRRSGIRSALAFGSGLRSALNSYQRRGYVAMMQRASRRYKIGRGRTKLAYTRKRVSERYGLLGGSDADRRFVYKKTRMPPRKRKQWKRFVNKVHAVAEKDLGTRTVLFNDQIEAFSDNSEVLNGEKSQTCCTLGLYTLASTKLWLNDLNQIGQWENESNSTAAAGETVDASTKVLFQSAVEDITIRNMSTYKVDDVSNLDARAAIELDFYEIGVGKYTGDEDGDKPDLSSLLNMYDTKDIGGTGYGMYIQNRGMTPFELPQALSRNKIKIYKKTKYFIPNGQTITYQIRDPKRHVMAYGDLTKARGFAVPGVTRLHFCIAKLVPGCNIGSTNGTFQCQFYVGSTRKYMYKIEGMNDSRERTLLPRTFSAANPS